MKLSLFVLFACTITGLAQAQNWVAKSDHIELKKNQNTLARIESEGVSSKIIEQGHFAVEHKNYTWVAYFMGYQGTQQLESCYKIYLYELGEQAQLIDSQKYECTSVDPTTEEPTVSFKKTYKVLKTLPPKIVLSDSI